MKNLLKLKTIRRIAGIITLVAVIGFSMSCDGDDGGGGDDGGKDGSTMKWEVADTGTIFDYVYNGKNEKCPIKAIAYGNGTFVAGGIDGRIATSPDGVTWTAVTSNAFEIDGYRRTINAIAYGNNNFVAAMEDRITTSTDGINWTDAVDISSIFNPVYGDGINAIAYGNNMFAAVGGFGTIGWGSKSRIAISMDCTDWTAVDVSNIFNDYAYWGNIREIVYANNKFFVGHPDGIIAYSSDGTTWTAVAGTFGFIQSIAYGNNMFVAVGDVIVTSTDGETWTIVEGNPMYEAYHKLPNYYIEYFFDFYSDAIAYGNNMFVAGLNYNAASGGQTRNIYGGIATSTDGETWTVVLNSGFGWGYNINAIAYGNGKFVAVGDNGRIAYSSGN